MSDALIGTSPDLVGGAIRPPGEWPRAALIGAWLEAMAAAACIATRQDPRSTCCHSTAADMARFALRHQLVRAHTWYMPRPDRALGGIRLGPDDDLVRIDYVQHVISGLASWLRCGGEALE